MEWTEFILQKQNLVTQQCTFRFHNIY